MLTKQPMVASESYPMPERNRGLDETTIPLRS
jgi:hypothetical protein